MTKGSETQLHEDDLIIPIYIDTNALLDIVASIEGGFSIVDKITSHTANSKSSDQSANISGGTEFGIPNFLSLIKVNLGGAFSWNQKNENAEEHTSERYHTYGSLFQRLLHAFKTQRIKTHQTLFQSFDGTSTSWNTIKPHTFIELQGKFLPNPLTESMGMISGLLNFMNLFTNPASGGTKNPNRKPQIVQPQNALVPVDSATIQQMKQAKDLIQGMLDELEQQDIRTVIVDIQSNTSQYKVVASLFTEYLRDKTLSELLYKDYKLFGKVVGKLENAASSINLLQGTSLRGIDDQSITQMLSAFSMSGSGLNLPTAETKISGPALQIVPIAIYV
jgi:hypothetical protein